MTSRSLEFYKLRLVRLNHIIPRRNSTSGHRPRRPLGSAVATSGANDSRQRICCFPKALLDEPRPMRRTTRGYHRRRTQAGTSTLRTDHSCSSLYEQLDPYCIETSRRWYCPDCQGDQRHSRRSGAVYVTEKINYLNVPPLNVPPPFGKFLALNNIPLIPLISFRNFSMPSFSLAFP